MKNEGPSSSETVPPRHGRPPLSRVSPSQSHPAPTRRDGKRCLAMRQCVVRHGSCCRYGDKQSRPPRLPAHAGRDTRSGVLQFLWTQNTPGVTSASILEQSGAKRQMDSPGGAAQARRTSHARLPSKIYRTHLRTHESDTCNLLKTCLAGCISNKLEVNFPHLAHGQGVGSGT